MIIQSEWKTWIAENLALGVHPKTIQQMLQQNGFSAGQARRELTRASSHPYTAAAIRLNDVSARKTLLVKSLLELIRLEAEHLVGPFQESHMDERIPAEYMDLFTGRAFGHFATINKDGTPQLSPVWVDYEEPFVLINTVVGRLKERNVRHDPRVTLEVMDPKEPYRYISVKGTVVERTTDNAKAHIDKLSERYYGISPYPFHRESEVRCVLKINVTNVAFNVSSL